MPRRFKDEAFHKLNCPVCQKHLDTEYMEYRFIHINGDYSFCHRECEEVYFDFISPKNEPL